MAIIAKYMKKAIFIDKDGTLIADVPYNVDTRKIRLNHGIGPFLAHQSQRDFKIVVISNQSGIARGYFSHDDLLGVRRKINELLHPYGVELHGFYYCPHYPTGVVRPYNTDCLCRKPEPGLLQQAATELGIDLTSSWMIGDILSDVEAGQRAGCQTVLYSTTLAAPPPTHVVQGFIEADALFNRFYG